MIGSEVRLDDVSARGEDRVAMLFDAHYAPMCRLAYVILGDQDAAEEAVMDAMLKTFSGWRRIRDLDRADLYLKRAVVNVCRSKIRRLVVERRASTVLRSRAERPDTGWDPEAHEVRREVWDAVLTLPERQRACVVLRYFEDLPEHEIAEILDCSVGTVKSQLHKARARLGKSLGATDGGER
jgi:RNA polymerase sigma-70 factor (sigma-E family)